MLFNSIEFIFCFLPIVSLGYFALGKRSLDAAILWLIAASLAFYGWWDPRYLLLLLGSVFFNYFIGQSIGCSRHASKWLALGIAINFGVLVYFKYANFFVDNLAAITGTELVLQHVILPLGISFFTFTQLAYLLDVRRREVKEYSFPKYLLFATFFPHLIAGPILHHKEIMPQFDDPQNFTPNLQSIGEGLAFFALGLAKKILLADSIAPYASDVLMRPAMAAFLFLRLGKGP